MLQFYRKPMFYGLLIELFLQISCSANSKTNSTINKSQFDVGHAHNETEVIKRSTKLNLSENLNDEIKLEFDSNTSTYNGCNFNETLLNDGKLFYFSNVDADQEKAGSSRLLFESDIPPKPEEYMFKNGKKVLIDEEFQKVHYDFDGTFREDDDNDEELVYEKPTHEHLVTWVNERYMSEYLSPKTSRFRQLKECKTT